MNSTWMRVAVVRNRLILGSLVLVAESCVLPASNATGIEFSWRFVEANTVDDEGEPRTRTCAGSHVDVITIDVQDINDPMRFGQFSIACDAGLSLEGEERAALSDAYLELKDGIYQIDVSVIPTEAFMGEYATQRMINVSGNQLTEYDLTFTRRPIQWTLHVIDAACDQAALTLVYDDPLLDLLEPPADAESTDILYRQNLTTQAGLSLAGQPIACDAWAGTHRVDNIDPGIYRLLVDIDGQLCEQAVTIDRNNPSTELDVSALDCSSS